MESRAYRVLCIAGLALSVSSAFVQHAGAQDRAAPLPLDVGEAWVPGIFAHQESVFSQTYVALAQERFEDVEEGLGHRAARDRYLEVYGIPPTLSVLRERLAQIDGEDCYERIDYEAISAFARGDTTQAGFGAWPESVEIDIERWVFSETEEHQVLRVQDLPRTQESRRRLALVQSLNRWRSGLEAVRRRLHCEGFLRGSIPTSPHMDWKTRASIEEFARRHRIYARGGFTEETLEALRTPPLELERRALLRVLSERARVDWGILEDGSGGGSDEVARVSAHIEALLHLETVEGARRFLRELGDIPDHQLIPVEGFALPEDYSANMDLRIVVDRGDVRYDPPFNEDGSPINFPVLERRPMLRVFVGEGATERLLAEWPTTIGGWRRETDRAGNNVWAYKQSAVGSGIWQHIVAAPVWLPPASTPNETLVQTIEDEDEGHNIIRRTLLGPGYASAYGLVAAIHRRRSGRSTVDDGIRTHGSVDYTSVFGDFSHGCHRLQNHLAVALFSFILAHRPHRYEGPVSVDYRRDVDLGERVESLRIEQRGERFVLTPPVPFRVLEGRVVGDLERPSTETFPVLP